MSLASNLRLSVVIPTADRGEAVRRTLGSVFGQSYRPFEVILVDNGKVALDSAIIDLRASIIRTEPRIGPGRARNIGARTAKGNLIAFLDDDDLWQPSYLEHVVRNFERSSADAVLGVLMRQPEKGEAYSYKHFPCKPEEQRRVFYSNPGFGGQNLTIRRDVFIELGGFDESLPASEDRDLAARLLIAGKKLISEPAAIAVLCDHGGARARHSMLRGNWRFITKHWRNMRINELYMALSVLTKRYVLLLLGR